MPDRIEFRNGIQIHAKQCDCEDCIVAWGEWMERSREIDLLALRDVELSQAKPATDQEWQAFFDAEFPRVRDINGHLLIKQGDGHQHNEDRECPVCDGGLSVCRDCGTYEAGLDNPCPRVKEGAKA